MSENNDDYNLSELLVLNFEYLNNFQKSVNKLGKIVNRIQVNMEENGFKHQDQEQVKINISNNSSSNNNNNSSSTKPPLCINYNLNRKTIDNINNVAQSAIDLLSTYNKFMDLDDNNSTYDDHGDSFQITTINNYNNNSNDSDDMNLSFNNNNNKPDVSKYKINAMQQYGSLNNAFTRICALREHFSNES